MVEDIQNYSTTVMFRGTPCMILGAVQQDQAPWQGKGP